MSLERMDSKKLTYRYTIPFEELNLDCDSVARSMGYSEGVSHMPFGERMENLLEEAPNHVHIEGGFRVFTPDAVSIEYEYLEVEERLFETGRIIAAPLSDSESLVIFVVTAGEGISQWSHALMEQGDPILAYYVDALGSETVERAADWLEAKIDAVGREQDMGSTNRYSPGYCDWHVTEQHKLFSLLPKDFCGITLTESALMQPTKSVSGVIGLGAEAVKKDYACSICDMTDCFRRNTRAM